MRRLVLCTAGAIWVAYAGICITNSGTFWVHSLGVEHAKDTVFAFDAFYYACSTIAAPHYIRIGLRKLRASMSRHG